LADPAKATAANAAMHMKSALRGRFRRGMLVLLVGKRHSLIERDRMSTGGYHVLRSTPLPSALDPCPRQRLSWHQCELNHTGHTTLHQR
jgi:hypothetical protein